ncbi:MAG: hypothetical protein EI684_14510 [Candidatus Viridilinea halotolerans]|uniref:Uncharacterized protein n=1 Tax=Candidatus Viridilinea halotolerans TaxID=2491704 RepID=A0A426TWD6_9CHLR|nr:MAG: hypothetical protein EI684_14510 [Candidatus Viridilinea halotolerans]
MPEVDLILTVSAQHAALANELEQRLAQQASVQRLAPKTLMIEPVTLILTLAASATSTAVAVASLAKIRAETAKFQAETAKIQAETVKIQIENAKAQAEASALPPAYHLLRDIQAWLVAQGQAEHVRITAPTGATRSFAEVDDAFLAALLARA